jgi:hypothetical protein
MKKSDFLIFFVLKFQGPYAPPRVSLRFLPVDQKVIAVACIVVSRALSSAEETSALHVIVGSKAAPCSDQRSDGASVAVGTVARCTSPSRLILASRLSWHRRRFRGS